MKNKLDKIIKNIIDKGGCNLSKNMEFLNYNSGYMVSIKDMYIIKKYDIKNLKKALKNVVKNIAINQCCGCWYNSEDNNIYIDISINIEDKQQAIKEGVKNNQLAIYDIKNNKTIYIKKISSDGVVNK